MTLNFGLLVESPLTVMLGTLGLMSLKAVVIIGLVMLAGVPFPRGLMLGLMLCQGGEFGFVIMAQAMDLRLLGEGTAGMVNLMIGISMALTAPAVLWFEKFTNKQIAKAPQNIEKFDSSESEALILGFGRFGQVTGRILAANQIHFTALDKNAEHIEFVKKFGNQVYYGDASRAEVLEAAGIGKVRTVIVAIDDPQMSQAIVEFIVHHYPKIDRNTSPACNTMSSRKGTSMPFRFTNTSPSILVTEATTGLSKFMLFSLNQAKSAF